MWKGASGCVGVTARDFQRAERIACEEALCRSVPGVSFSILQREVAQETDAVGLWTEFERYRDVEDIERLVFFTFTSLEVAT